MLRRKAGIGEGYQDIGKDFPDMENMLLLADDTGISGPSMPDSRRTMVTEQTRHVPAVIYCFETAIDLEETVRKGARPLQTLPARKISRNLSPAVKTHPLTTRLCRRKPQTESLPLPMNSKMIPTSQTAKGNLW